MLFGDAAPNKGVAILAVVAVILLVVAIVLSIARRPTVATQNESSTPALDSIESKSSSY
jgi:hypothetical protein